jgi:acetyltransferase-like isoleucine patch superfamily enzyme
MLADASKFKHIGKDVLIYEFARFVNEQVIEIGDRTQIDDFSFVNGGSGIKFGRCNHVCSFVSIIGGGELITGDYVGIAAGCRIITGSHQHQNGKRMVSSVPAEQQEILRGKIVLEQDVFIGSNAIIYPNVTIGQGAIIGAGSLVTRNVEPWTVNMGYPAHVVGRRPEVKF